MFRPSVNAVVVFTALPEFDRSFDRYILKVRWFEPGLSIHCLFP